MSAVQANAPDLPPELKNVVENHTIQSQALASFVDSLKPVGETIRAHHERYDGTGFPDGLAGEMILGLPAVWLLWSITSHAVCPMKWP